jgi:hypothetical protein
MKIVDTRHQDDESATANQREVARLRKLNARVMRVLIALVILTWAANIWFVLFAHVPEEPRGRPYRCVVAVALPVVVPAITAPAAVGI